MNKPYEIELDVHVIPNQIQQFIAGELPPTESLSGVNWHIQDYILKTRGGSNELTIREQERLVKSLLAKTPGTDYKEISVNKAIQKLLKTIGKSSNTYPENFDMELHKSFRESFPDIRERVNFEEKQRKLYCTAHTKLTQMPPYTFSLDDKLKMLSKSEKDALNYFLGEG